MPVLLTTATFKLAVAVEYALLVGTNLVVKLTIFCTAGFQVHVALDPETALLKQPVMRLPSAKNDIRPTWSRVAVITTFWPFGVCVTPLQVK